MKEIQWIKGNIYCLIKVLFLDVYIYDVQTQDYQLKFTLDKTKFITNRRLVQITYLNIN